MNYLYNIQKHHVQRPSMLHTVQTVLLFALVTIISTACGTIMHGSTQQIAISSNPTDAKVFIDDQNKGTTPLNVNLKRKGKSMNLRIVLDGYLPYETKLNRKVSGWAWGNLAFGGLPGVVIDAISGGLYKLTPEQIESDLKDKTASLKRTDNGMYIAVVLKAKPGWQQIDRLEPVK